MAGGVVLGEGVQLQVVEEDPLEIPDGDRDDTSRNEAASMSSYVTLTVMTLALNLFLLLLTSPAGKLLPKGRPLLAHWYTTPGQPMRVFFCKMAVFNTLVTVVVHIIHQALLSLKESPDDKKDCVRLASAPWLPLVVCGVSLVIAAVRFLAMLLPHSRSVQGYTIYSPPPELAQLGASYLTSSFSKVIRPYLIIGGLVVASVGYILLGFVPQHPDVSGMFEVCAAPLRKDEEEYVENLLLLILLGVLPALFAILLEHLYYCCAFRSMAKSDAPGFYLILSSPFVISLFVTTCSGWLFTMTLTFVAHGSIPAVQTSYWKYFGALDSFWMLVLFLLATCRYRSSAQ